MTSMALFPTRKAPHSVSVNESSATSPETRLLLEFVTELAAGKIPERVLHQSKRCLLDFLGLAIAASGTPASRISQRELGLLGGNPQSLVLGTATRLRSTDAALVNGMAAHVFDLDDTHVPTILHATTPLYAAGLALGEPRKCTGIELLAAHALGYEAGARVSLALYPEHYDVGWHMTGTTGVIAAAIASARILGLRAVPAINCLGIAATQASGHREHFGTMTKSFHAGRAASSGVLAALLAEGGFTAAPNPLQGRRGMFTVMSVASSPADLVEELGDRWELMRNGVKPYACGVVIHPAADAAYELRFDRGVLASEVGSIDLRVNPLVLELTGNLDPRTGLAGKFSTVFACAIVLIDGSAGEADFTDANVVRSDVRALMAKIKLIPDETVNHSQAELIARTTDGREQVVRISAARGTPANPLDDAALAEKFHGLVDPILAPTQARSLEQQVWEIDGAPNLDRLLEATIPRV
jgi:2-methylcitrate dehydratase PrpD